MNIANLPVASPFSPTPLEPRQRGLEFRHLDTAIRIGNITEALKIVGLLQLNAPNATLSPQKQRDFGHDNQAGNELEALENALRNGNLAAAQSAFASLKVHGNIVEEIHRRPEDERKGSLNFDEDKDKDSEGSEEREQKSESGESPLDILA